VRGWGASWAWPLCARPAAARRHSSLPAEPVPDLSSGESDVSGQHQQVWPLPAASRYALALRRHGAAGGGIAARRPPPRATCLLRVCACAVPLESAWGKRAGFRLRRCVPLLQNHQQRRPKQPTRSPAWVAGWRSVQLLRRATGAPQTTTGSSRLDLRCSGSDLCPKSYPKQQRDLSSVGVGG
jgi:hypothetical protein